MLIYNNYRKYILTTVGGGGAKITDYFKYQQHYKMYGN